VLAPVNRLADDAGFDFADRRRWNRRVRPLIVRP
jgi:hypothetical protein